MPELCFLSYRLLWVLQWSALNAPASSVVASSLGAMFDLVFLRRSALRSFSNQWVDWSAKWTGIFGEEWRRLGRGISAPAAVSGSAPALGANLPPLTTGRTPTTLLAAVVPQRAPVLVAQSAELSRLLASPPLVAPPCDDERVPALPRVAPSSDGLQVAGLCGGPRRLLERVELLVGPAQALTPSARASASVRRVADRAGIG